MNDLFLEAADVLKHAELIYSNDQLNTAMDTLADNINNCIDIQSLNQQPVIVISVMNGGLVITGQLLPRFTFPLQLDFIHATRYRNNTQGGVLDWKSKTQNDLQGRTLVILDDILDEGYTLDEVVKFCRSEGASKVYTAVLLDKKHDRRKQGVSCDFIGLEVEDKYVFGFGMDYKGYHRNLDAIYALNTNK